MGVVGLSGWIQRLYAQHQQSKPSIDWTVYRGKKIGIDILGFLYRAKSRRNSTLAYVARLVAAFRATGIHPVPIFDGKPPDEKQSLLEDRARQRESASLRCNRLQCDLLAPGLTDEERTALLCEVQRLTTATTYFTGEERELVKQLFYICGVKPLNASGEADNILAYLYQTGEIAAVVSHDMDLLPRGVETLLVPDAYALPGDASGWVQHSLSDVCKLAGLSYDQFVNQCVLMGCDYTHGLPKVPPRAAHTLARRCRNLRDARFLLEGHGILDATPYERAARMLKGVDDVPSKLMNERQWKKWGSIETEPEWDALFGLRSTLLRSLSDAEFRTLCAVSYR